MACPSGTFSYSIQAGDTLYKIASKYNTTYQAILAANPGINPNWIYIGQQICVPVLTNENTNLGNKVSTLKNENQALQEHSVSAGYAHSLAVKRDGTVWAWGWNAYGQLGDVSTTDKNTPVQVTGLADVFTVAAGERHSLAVKRNGTIWAWGANYYGQLGDGSNTDKNTPVQVTGLANVVAVSAGRIYSLALKDDGTVWAWGLNDKEQLGDGTTVTRSTPVQVVGLSIRNSFYCSRG